MYNYLIGSFVAVFGVGSVLIFSTLDLTGVEVVLLLCILIFSVAIMLLVEIISYKKHIAPIRLVFLNDKPSLDELKRAFTQTAKFPSLTLRRIMLPHLFGLSIPASVTTMIFIYSDLITFPYYYVLYAWFGAILIAAMHGLIEFFLTLRIIQPVLSELTSKTKAMYDYQLTLAADSLFSIKKKLLFSSLFLAIYPIFLFTLASEVQSERNSLYLQYWQWAAVVLFVVVLFAILGSFLLVNNIIRPMEQLKEGFLQVEKKNYQQLDNYYTDEFSTLVSGFNHMVSSIQYREETNKKLLESFFTVFATTLDARDAYTAGHSLRVADYCVKIGERAELESEQIDLLKKSALLHDIGKIGINDDVLLKDGILTDAEFDEIKKHPLIGERILKQIQPSDAMVDLIPGVKHHHERYDGKGYPSGLKGEDTPLFGRIMAVADAFDAMTSDRPYRDGMSVEKATSILKEGKGTQWDARFSQIFIEIIEEGSLK